MVTTGIFGFIIGTGRCGTTLLAQMLNAHNQICIPPEIQILFEYSNNGKRLLEVFESGEALNFGPKNFIDLIHARSPHKFELYFDYENFFHNLEYPIKSFQMLANQFYGQIAASRNKNIFLEQTPWYGQRIDILNKLFPKAKFIHMIRDGRDVAISYSRTPWWHKDLMTNLQQWHNEIANIRRQSENLLDSSRIINIRYEDLVDNPRSQLVRCCAHLGVNFNESMLNTDAYIDYTQYSRINTRAISSVSLNDWKNGKISPTFDGSKYAWKRLMFPEFESLSPELVNSLKLFGYEV